MAKYILAGSDINWLAILALLTFFIVFALALVLVFGRSRKQYEEVEAQPLTDSYLPTDQNEPL